MSVRKQRKDAGVARGPKTTPRREFLKYFSRLEKIEQEALIEDMRLLQEMRDYLALPAPKILEVVG